MAKEKETKTIDWNIWHNAVKDSVRAFDVETTAAVCKKLGITYFSEDESVYASDLRNWIEDICEKLIKWEVNGIDGIVEDHVNAYKEDDTGIKVAELHLRNSDVDDELMVDPNIVIKLRETINPDTKKKEPYFEIYFEIVGQFW